jgi:RES domain-containing protein
VISVWRLCTAKYLKTAYSGEGARLYGGRWSPVGLPIAYASAARALAVLEVLANAGEPDRLVALEWVLVPAELSDTLVETPARFPAEWRQYPHAATTQNFGLQWAQEQRSVALRVPSAVVPGEFNFLLNPQHPDFGQVKIGKAERFTFDPRLVS